MFEKLKIKKKNRTSKSPKAKQQQSPPPESPLPLPTNQLNSAATATTNVVVTPPRKGSRKSRFIHQVDTHLQFFSPGRDELLELHFMSCTIDLSDVEHLKTRLDQCCATAGCFPNAILPQPIHFSFNCCRLGCQQTLMALMDICRPALDDRLWNVTSLNFSLSDFHFDDICQIVNSCASQLRYLKLSMRYQSGILGPLLEPCSKYDQLTCLKLDARFPLESRVRLVCMQELVTAMLSLSNLQEFALTCCEMQDEVFALLTGGLLAKKETLTSVQLQTQGGNGPGLTDATLPLLAHYLTEFPCLRDLDLELQDCRKLLHNAPPETTKEFMNAVQNCSPGLSVRLTWHNVGWSEEAALALLEAAAYNTTADDISLDLQDFDFVQTERFIYQLCTHLPAMASLVDLKIVDTCTSLSSLDESLHQDSQESRRDYSWWNEDQLELLVEALSKNDSVQSFELTIGNHTLDAQESYAIRSALKRNQDQAFGNSPIEGDLLQLGQD